MILVDTSVWISHLRMGVPKLVTALDAGQVLMHPFVLGEIACGHLNNRREVLELLAELPMVCSATDAEVLKFIERSKLMGRGIGYVDMHLLASAAFEGNTTLWTQDKRLNVVAEEFQLGYSKV